VSRQRAAYGRSSCKACVLEPEDAHEGFGDAADDEAEAEEDEDDAGGDDRGFDCDDGDAGEDEEGAEQSGEAERVEHVGHERDHGGKRTGPAASGARKCAGFKSLAALIEGMSDDDGGRKNLRMPDEDEVFAEVTDMLGANRVRVRCADGTERTARIPGRMQKRIWIREGDIVLVEPWDWQDEKADVVWRYEKSEADQLREEGHIE
jgi:translation initiation factor 1A